MGQILFTVDQVDPPPKTIRAVVTDGATRPVIPTGALQRLRGGARS